jgi:hypothetical protein
LNKTPSKAQQAVFAASTVIAAMFGHSENRAAPILVTLDGMAALVSPAQPLKAKIPMLVTLVGMMTFVSPVQERKAEIPMLVTPDGII